MSAPKYKLKPVKKVNFHNPTFTSFDVTYMFNPEVFGQKDYYQRRYSVKKKDTNDKDTLSKAENQFDEKRSKSVIHEPYSKIQVQQKITKNSNEAATVQKNLNFFDHRSIRNKQLHGFNILSNM